MLGKHGSRKSKDTYKRLIAEFVASGSSPVFGEKPSRLTIAMVARAYLKHAKTYYPNGNEYANVVLAAKPINDLYADHMATKFGPTKYKACRGWWLNDSTRSRQYVNKQAKRLVAIIKWAVAEGLFPVANYQAIKCVEPLRFGRVSAPESKPIIPVDDATVSKTLKFCTPVLADMIRLQLLVGCRPGELVQIKPCMVKIVIAIDRLSRILTDGIVCALRSLGTLGVRVVSP